MTETEKKTILTGIERSLSDEVLLLDRARNSCDLHKFFHKGLQEILPGHPFDEFGELIVLNDFHAFTIYSLLDLYVATKGMLNATTDWEKLFFFKHAYFVIFESLDTY